MWRGKGEGGVGVWRVKGEGAVGDGREWVCEYTKKLP